MSKRRGGTRTGAAGWTMATALVGAAAVLSSSAAMQSGDTAATDSDGAAAAGGAPTLEETRMKMGKWIETQQIISRERIDWQQGKEILLGRLELTKDEVITLEEKIAQAQSSVAETSAKRDELLAQTQELKDTGAQLAETVTAMEAKIRGLFPKLPQPVQTKLDSLYQKMPVDPATTRATIAERFQTVLSILNELNTANQEIAVNYEIHTLADGKSSEVKTIYVGLAQAYYVSARGEGGIGRPSDEGWKWEPAPAVSNDVLTALEILQGKHTPAFVPLPVRIQ